MIGCVMEAVKLVCASAKLVSALCPVCDEFLIVRVEIFGSEIAVIHDCCDCEYRIETLFECNEPD